jgi:transcriptional regulator with XRE-family HTH domain
MVSMASDSLGRRLLLARKKRGLTMLALGNKAGLSASTINHIEKGRQSPAADTTERLARALEVDPCWLAYGSGVTPEWTQRKS